MARKRLSMSKIRDVLRLKYGLDRSNREIGGMLRISHSTVGSYVRRAREAGVSWPLPDDLDDGRLEAMLYPPTAPSRVRRPEPDWARVHWELGRHKGVTLQLLWFEYVRRTRTGISTAASATATGSGADASTWCCARSIGQARRRSSTTRARRSR